MKQCISLIIVVFLCSVLFSQNDSVKHNIYKKKDPFSKQVERASKSYKRYEKKRAKQLAKNPATFSPCLYSKEIDNQTGYSYFGAKYYSSGLNIWLPVEPETSAIPSPSPYKYVNNPLENVDTELTNVILHTPTILQEEIEKKEVEE